MLGSYIFTDPKGEIYDQTAGYLKANGYEIKVLNLVNPSNSDGYNPLMHISSDLDVDIIASTVIKGQKSDSGADPYWDDNAEVLLKALIYYLMATRPPEEQNLGSCAELVRAANSNSGSNLLTELMNQLPLDHQARTFYKNIEIASDRTYASILSSLQAKLGKFDSKEIAGVTSTDTINFEDIGKKKTAVYVISSDTHTAYDFILTIFFSQMIQQLYNYADKKPDGVHAKLKMPVFFILDEFANIGKIPDFDKKISTSRSRGISFSVILQNLDQLEAVYEKSYETIMGNCDTHVFLGSNSFKTVEYFSKLLGEKTITGQSVSKGKDPQSKKKTKQISENIMARALMTPDELRRMDMDSCIIFEKGIKPVLGEKFYFFKTTMLTDLNKNRIDHNNFNTEGRGIWRKYNPYNPFVEEGESRTNDLKVESLDDLFEDNFNKIEEKEVEEISPVNALDFEKEDFDNEKDLNNNLSKENNHSANDMFSDLMGFEEIPKIEQNKKIAPVNTINEDEEKSIVEIDVEKELEAKFNELFGNFNDE